MSALPPELLASVLASPDDDTPRLVCADWLDEHGEAERAAFIRLQCRLEAYPAYSLEGARLRAEAEALLERNRREWCAALSTRLPLFRRGFVERITLEAAAFVGGGREWFARDPIRGLTLMQPDNERAELVESPDLGRLSWLELVVSENGAEWLEGLAAGTALASLRHLGLVVFGLHPPDIGRLAALPAFGRLESLDLDSNPVGDAGALALARSETLTRLRTLVLMSDDETPYTAAIRAGGAGAIATSANLASLRSLNLAYQRVGDAGLARFAESGTLTELAELDLRENGVGEVGTSGLEALARSGGLPALRALTLADNEVGDAGARELASWPGLARLEWLDLSHAYVGDGGVRALLEAPVADNARLDLRGNRFRPEWVGPLRERFGERVLLSRPDALARL